ncbi:hypothetical protein ACIO3O_14130 [Streptomyces sp. NPDC087440]|uniref:hypothetical protein n=1 Tax=Streptomyces sp. NPDC087440 TaxID=3365790 RepID=UPI00381554AF
MRRGLSPVVGRRSGLLLLVVGALGAAVGCGSPAADAAADAQQTAQRAREVGAAWDGSSAAEQWGVGYHPLGDVIQLPRGGLRQGDDTRAYADRNVVLRGTLPAAPSRTGRVAWAGGETRALPLRAAADTYRTLVGSRTTDGPHLTVTGARLGEMTVPTSRGSAVVPAWLFSLEGYDTPLKHAAVQPSPLPRPPIGEARDVPGQPVRQLVRTGADGRSVTVVAVHGACDDGPVVEALETSGSVVLSVTAGRRTRDGLCTKEGRLRQVTVTLDRALGKRVLLDAQTGLPIPYRPSNGPSPTWR